MHSHGPKPHEISPETRKAGHELGDVPLGTFIRYGIGLAVLAAVSFGVTWVTFKGLGDYESRRSARPTPIQSANLGQLPPNPRLQLNPLRDWLVFKAEQDSVVGSYGWVDKGQGRVRLPVDVAIEIMAGRNWPHRPGEYKPTGVSSGAPVGLPGPDNHGAPQSGSTHSGALQIGAHGAAPHDSATAAPGTGGHH